MKTEKSTRDIYLAAVWMASGAKFIKADRTDPKHQVFHFSMETPDDEFGKLITPNKSMDVIEKQWINGELMINAVKFKDAIQRMKGVIYSS